MAEDQSQVLNCSDSSNASTIKFDRGRSICTSNQTRNNYSEHTTNNEEDNNMSVEECPLEEDEASTSHHTTHPSSSDMDVEEIVMAAVWKNGKLGAAYYTMETSELFVLADIVDVNPEFHMLRSLFMKVQPSLVISTSGMPQKFVTALRNLTVGQNSEDDGSVSDAQYRKLQLLKGPEYRLESCKRRILNLHLATEPRDFTESEHTNFVHCLVDFNLESLVLSLGMLLKYLDKYWTETNLLLSEKVVPILEIKNLSLENIVTIDEETYGALQIFSQETHPSNFKKWAPGSSREGLSVFGILNRCKSTLGCKKMRVLFFHPSNDIEILNQRLDVIDFCLKPGNIDVVKNIVDCLRYIRSINKVITRIINVSASVREWKTFYNTLHHAILIGELCRAQPCEVALFKQIANCLTDELYEIAHYLYQIIDFEESEVHNRFVVKLGVDEDLDKKKQKHGSLPNLLSVLAHQELQELPPEVKECSVVYIPEIGYLLAVPARRETVGNEKDVNIAGLQFMFKANNQLYYKSARCKELDSALGDISIQITEHETMIMLNMVKHVQKHFPQLTRILELIALLDCLIALASVAQENFYVRPVLTNEKIIEIKQGRHPLQELQTNMFVPNDTASSENTSLMKILTGPNASGKSVYLKQVALICFMAHIGSFVPAEAAKIGMLDNIHTRIQDLESVATKLSSFMIDIRQMSLSINSSTSSSLVIIDEFGKGTSEVDGQALLAACLINFLKREKICPHVFVSTHFHSTKEYLSSLGFFESQVMEHMCENDQIVYLYKLKSGESGTSFAHVVAEAAGIDNAIIKRSLEVLESINDNKQLHRLARNKITKKVSMCEELGNNFIALQSGSQSPEEFLRSLKKKLKY